MNKIIKLGLSVLVFGSFLIPSLIMSAQAADNPFKVAQNQVNTVQNNAGVEEGKDLPDMIGSLINIALSFVGILLLGYMLYAGFLWMTSGGDEKGKEKAIMMIKNSVIGLLIVIASFAISNYVLKSLIDVTSK